MKCNAPITTAIVAVQACNGCYKQPHASVMCYHKHTVVHSCVYPLFYDS
jgi:hypothetical protein